MAEKEYGRVYQLIYYIVIYENAMYAFDDATYRIPRKSFRLDVINTILLRIYMNYTFTIENRNYFVSCNVLVLVFV